MPILRINQQPGGTPNRYRIDVSAGDLPGFQPLNFTTEIEFSLSPQDGERIRWYLEEYLQFYQDPAPKFAKRAEALMAERGEALFRGIFDGSRPGSQLWTLIEPHLSSTRIEITTGIAEATAIPWEKGRPYHIVHFDGHGIYADPKDLEGAGTILSSLTLKGEATGARGHLVFEDPGSETRSKFVDGFKIGEFSP